MITAGKVGCVATNGKRVERNGEGKSRRWLDDNGWGDAYMGQPIYAAEEKQPGRVGI
jgi:hypothetical protein